MLYEVITIDRAGLSVLLAGEVMAGMALPFLAMAAGPSTLFVNGDEAGGQDGAAGLDRITSYNVCYTKLLRLGGSPSLEELVIASTHQRSARSCDQVSASGTRSKLV